MRISNKIHSGTAVAAAVIMLITTFLSVGTNVFTLIANFRYYEKIADILAAHLPPWVGAAGSCGRGGAGLSYL